MITLSFQIGRAYPSVRMARLYWSTIWRCGSNCDIPNSQCLDSKQNAVQSFPLHVCDSVYGQQAQHVPAHPTAWISTECWYSTNFRHRTIAISQPVSISTIVAGIRPTLISFTRLMKLRQGESGFARSRERRRREAWHLGATTFIWNPKRASVRH